MKNVTAVVGLAILQVTVSAYAHTSSTGVATIDARSSVIAFRLIVVPAELGEGGVDIPKAASGDAASAARVASWLQSLVRIAVNDKDCAVTQTRIKNSELGGERVALSLDFGCASSPGRLQLTDKLSTQFGEHYRTIVSVSRTDDQREERVLDAAKPQALFEFAQSPVSGLAQFVGLGAGHMLSGFDHLLFLGALLVGSRGLRGLLMVVTMFTLAHSISLALAVLGIFSISPAVVEPLIAASIVWVAIENVWLKPSTPRRCALAFVFGLVHGLAFAEALSELRLTGWPLLEALFGFNLGVELAQGLVVLLLAPLLAWVARAGCGDRLFSLASLAIGAIGAIWLVQRVLFS